MSPGTLPATLYALGSWQWAEDDDAAMAAARQAWDRMDALASGALVALAILTTLVCAVLLLREKAASWRRRLVATSVMAAGCAFFAMVVGRMGVIWLVADPQEAGGPVPGSGAYWYWTLWLGGATLLALAGVIASFIIVGAEDL
jgi:hypothetical protein